MNSTDERGFLRQVLRSLETEELARSIDVQFALYIYEKADEARVECAALACCLSAASGQGSVCLRLREISESTLWLRFGLESVSADTLLCSAVVGLPGEYVPLIVDDGNAYMHRYWHHETFLASRILALSQQQSHTSKGSWMQWLQDLPAMDAESDEWDFQALAVTVALQRRFCVISGGPGTGKTTTVSRLVAAYLGPDGGEGLRIAIAAPTGKAAARLDEALAEKLGPDAHGAVERAATLHRLLGYQYASGHYRHGPDNPLPHDLVIVDEASMVDLPMMSRLVGALRSTAGLILLGDKDQLASVQAGSVLADICRGAEGYTSQFTRTLELVCGRALPQLPGPPHSAVGDCVVLLERSYRFDATSGIGKFAAAIRGSDFASCEKLLTAGLPDLEWVQSSADLGRLEAVVPTRFREALSESDIDAALGGLDSFRILCAERRGTFGVSGMNRAMETLLRRDETVGREGEFYRNQLVMVNHNDYQQQLFNGEVGVVRGIGTAEDGALACYFPSHDPEMGVRMCLTSRLPGWETAFALTVHKSQGSEFDEVLIVVPPNESKVLTRELLYTAVTRARNKVTLWCSPATLRAALARPARRHSGLAERLSCTAAGIV